MSRVDAHHHLWDVSRRDYPWMDGPWADPLRGVFDVAALAPLAAAEGSARPSWCRPSPTSTRPASCSRSPTAPR